MAIRSRHGLALAVLSCALCVGCGGNADGRAATDLIPVKGKVTYKGRPITRGVVSFEPDGFGRPASGPIQSDGSFALGTHKDGDGVVPGEHRVSISGFDKALARDRVLAKYSSPNSSHLTAKVDAEHTEFAFDLK